MPENAALYELNSKAMQLINIEAQCAKNPSSSQDVLGELSQLKRAVLTEAVDNITYIKDIPEIDQQQLYENFASLINADESNQELKERLLLGFLNNATDASVQNNAWEKYYYLTKNQPAG